MAIQHHDLEARLLDSATRADVESLAEDMKAEAAEYRATMAELRGLAGLTQVEVARRLGKPQSEVSRVENTRDARLSTLRAYVDALGGELELTVRIPGRVPVTLELADLDDD